jgi:hypothetical protein
MLLKNGVRSVTVSTDRCHGSRGVRVPRIPQKLLEMIGLGYTGTGRKYGVSDNSIRKWLK